MSVSRTPPPIWDVAFRWLWLGYQLLIGGAVAVGVLILFLARYPGIVHSPLYLLCSVAAVVAGGWAVLVMRWAARGVAQPVATVYAQHHTQNNNRNE
ncbi:MAG: hypothetical protein ACRDRO_26000 [Pseudonocardiaceae bacterium]